MLLLLKKRVRNYLFYRSLLLLEGPAAWPSARAGTWLRTRATRSAGRSLPSSISRVPLMNVHARLTSQLDSMPAFSCWLCVASMAALVAVAAGCASALALQIGDIRIGEELSEAADQKWDHAFSVEDAGMLTEALDAYERILKLKPFLESSEAPAGPFENFAQWLANPLRLRCMRRVAAGREMLRKDFSVIVQAHEALLRENYCATVESEASEFLSDLPPSWNYASCLAPHARGTILFASTPAKAEAAFGRAMQLNWPQGGPALTWTTRWQLPDIHTPGLLAQPWWPHHPAAAQLEASFQQVLAEFEQILAEFETSKDDRGEAFTRRRERCVDRDTCEWLGYAAPDQPAGRRSQHLYRHSYM